MNEQLTVTDLYERYGTALKWRLARQLHNLADAEDALQEVFVRAVRYWPALPDKRYPWPWLRTLARSVVIDAGRYQGGKEKQCLSLEEAHVGMEDDSSNYDAHRNWFVDPRQPDPLDVVIARDEARAEWGMLTDYQRGVLLREAFRGDGPRAQLYSVHRNVAAKRKRRAAREGVRP